MSGKTSDKGPLDQQMTVQEDGHISYLSMQWFYDPTEKPDGGMNNFYTVRTSHVQPLICGDETMPRVLHALQSAEKTIDIGVWCFDPALCLKGYNPDLNRTRTLLDSLVPPYDASPRIGDVLLAAAHREVNIRIMVWTLGDLMYNPIHWEHAISEYTNSEEGRSFIEQVKRGWLIAKEYSGANKNEFIRNLVGWNEITAAVCLFLYIKYKDSITKELISFLKDRTIDYIIKNHPEKFISKPLMVYRYIADIFPKLKPFLLLFIDYPNLISNLSYRVLWYNSLREVPNIQMKLVGKPITRSLIDKHISSLICKKDSFDKYGRRIYDESMFLNWDDVKEKVLEFGTHHQKCVIVDHGTPHAVGFVMGNNLKMVDFDSLKHPEDAGVNGGRFPGEVPRQDISSFVRGKVLDDMNDNFNSIWNNKKTILSPACSASRESHAPTWIQVLLNKYTWLFSELGNPDPLSMRWNILSRPEVDAARLRSIAWLAGQKQLPQGSCQLSTTRMDFSGQENSIAKAYRRAIDCCTSFVYFENQYFRYEKMAIALKARGYNRRVENEKKSQDPLYYFTVINKDVEMFAYGSTYDMMEELGHSGQMPAEAHNRYKKLLEDKKKYNRSIACRKYRPKAKELIFEHDEINLVLVQSEMKRLEQEYPQIKPGKNPDAPSKPEDIKSAKEAFSLRENEYVKGHIAILLISKLCSAISWEKGELEIDGDGILNLLPWVERYKYEPVYVHTKTMIVDDVYIIIGSANMHERGMEYDNEIDISTTRPGVARDTRRALFAAYTENDTMIMNEQATWAEIYAHWKKLLDENWERHYEKEKLKGMLFYFYDPVVDATSATLD